MCQDLKEWFEEFETWGKKARIDVIDVFEFNDAGRVQSMKAYWGPENFTQG